MNEYITLEQVHWAAKECQKQQSGEMSVFHFIEAVYVFGGLDVYSNALMSDNIELLGSFIQGRDVRWPRSFRHVPITIDSHVAGAHPDDIPRLIKAWCEAVRERRLTAEEAYQEFERIHPFVDGNGRAGAILYNLIRGSIEHPVDSPPFHA